MIIRLMKGNCYDTRKISLTMMVTQSIIIQSLTLIDIYGDNNIVNDSRQQSLFEPNENVGQNQ
jgi:hypothetical protein